MTLCQIGALCRAAYNGGNAVALPQTLGLTDEADVQGFKDFLKRFGCKLKLMINVININFKWSNIGQLSIENHTQSITMLIFKSYASRKHNT